MNTQPLSEQRLLLYSSRWQALRVSWLKEYRDDGGWTTLLGAKRALAEAASYLNEDVTEVEAYARHWRVINCLNAVRMGFGGQGRFETEQSHTVALARDKYQVVYKRLTKAHGRLNLKTMGVTLDEWKEQTVGEFMCLLPLQRLHIAENLMRRKALHPLRDELGWYLRAILPTFKKLDYPL